MAAQDIHACLKAIADQRLSKEELLTRLDAMITAENRLPEDERDQALIEACLDLQWFLLKGEHYQSRKEEAGKKLAHELEKHAHRGERESHYAQKTMRRRIAAIVCCVILLVMLPFAGQKFLSREWIEGESVQNGEIYRLNGEEVDPHLVDQAIADAENNELILSTTDAAMIEKIPGVSAIQIQDVPEGWERSEYLYMNIDERITYIEVFVSTDEPSQDMTYMYMAFPDAQSVDVQVQQNDTGDVWQVNGIDVYFSQNHDLLVAVWNEGLTSSTLYGPIDRIQMEHMIESIGRDQE